MVRGELARRARVGFGLARIAAAESLDERSAARLRSLVLRGPLRRTRKAVDPLRPGRISERSFDAYTSGANAVRIARLVELVPPGRRILDVGIGFGYVTGVLMRDRSPSHYCGIDLRETYTNAARSMIEANDLSDENVALEVKSVFDIDAEFGRRHDPDLVLILEVLEHVPFPAHALRVINEAVRPGTRVIFTVPLNGRLDGVWGHRATFDHRRLRSICARAGLTMQRAEPLYGVWSLVEATTGAKPKPDHLIPGEWKSYTFTSVPVKRPADEFRRPGDPEIQINPSAGAVRAKVPGDLAGRSTGLRFEVKDPRVARIELEIIPPDAARRVSIETVDEDGNVRHAWSATGHRGERDTFLLRPGRSARGLEPSGGKSVEGVRWLDVCIEPEEGTRLATLSVYRLDYLEA